MQDLWQVPCHILSIILQKKLKNYENVKTMSVFLKRKKNHHFLNVVINNWYGWTQFAWYATTSISKWF